MPGKITSRQSSKMLIVMVLFNSMLLLAPAATPKSYAGTTPVLGLLKDAFRRDKTPAKDKSAPKPYPKEDLYVKNGQRVYTGQNLDQIAFPLGGIGAGQINLGGSGQLQDFSIFNRPALGTQPNNGATIYAKADSEEAVTRIIEGPVTHSRIYAGGRQALGGNSPGGFPHMKKAAFRGEFPFAAIDFEDPSLPLQVSLEAFSPFIPLDVKNSAIPTAVLKYTFRNSTSKTVNAQFAYHMRSPFLGWYFNMAVTEGCINTERREGKVTSLEFANAVLREGDPRKGTFAIALLEPDTIVQETFGLFFQNHILWKELATGKLEGRKMSHEPWVPGQKRQWSEGGAIGVSFSLKPGESRTIPLILTWHVPNSDVHHDVPAEDIAKWEKEFGKKVGESPAPNPIKWQPYYATQFKDAFDVAKYVGENLDSLENRSRRFHDLFFQSSYPSIVLDAVSANLGILKSPTCLLLEHNGNPQFWAYEGCEASMGSCHSSCTHVWNYTQALPHLFPQLERSLRTLELEHSMDEKGHVQFRSRLPIGPASHGFHAAADGQLGGIMKVWREWQISGDAEWLKNMYPLAKKSLDWSIQTWDPKRMGVLTGSQHNTYDLNFEGPNGMLTSFYLGALRAMADMASHLGKAEDAATYTELASKGQQFANEQLFNGEYYYQRVWINGRELAETEDPAFQYATGCLADGVIGQWFADLFGLPNVLDPQQTRSHLASVFRYNFKNDLSGHANPSRPGFALNDEAGLLLCTWPKGNQLTLPFGYAHEVWTGIEYQVASHMIMHGLVDEGLTVVKAARDRHDGFRRNPWSEFECGAYYARAISSYALLHALSGFRYSAVDQRMEINPRISDKQVTSFFSTNSGWGKFMLDRGGDKTKVTIHIEEGSLPVKKVFLPFLNGKNHQATLAGSIAKISVPETNNGLEVSLPESAIAKPGQPIMVRID